MTTERIKALVATKVMGWELLHDTQMVFSGHMTYKRIVSSKCLMDWQETIVPDFPARIVAAWTVVEKMESEGWHWAILSRSKFLDEGPHEPHVTFYRMGGDYVLGQGAAQAPITPLAICLAALKAKGVEVPA